VTFDPLEALRVLNRHGVRYVIIGGLAAAIHGSPAVTYDTDICYARDDKNLRRLAAALQELEARLRGPGVPAEGPFQLDAKTLAIGDSFTCGTTAGSLDILATPSGTRGFDDLDGGAIEADLDGLIVRVASIDDLIRMKRAAGRTKDSLGIVFLQAIKEELEGPGGG
jgi:hypothetical protein